MAEHKPVPGDEVVVLRNDNIGVEWWDQAGRVVPQDNIQVVRDWGPGTAGNKVSPDEVWILFETQIGKAFTWRVRWEYLQVIIIDPPTEAEVQAAIKSIKEAS